MSKNIILACAVYYGHTDISKLLMHSCAAMVIAVVINVNLISQKKSCDRSFVPGKKELLIPAGLAYSESKGYKETTVISGHGMNSRHSRTDMKKRHNETG